MTINLKIIADLQNFNLFLNEYPAACCDWDGQETDLRNVAFSKCE